MYNDMNSQLLGNLIIDKSFRKCFCIDVQLQIGFITQQKANSLLQEGSIDSQAHSNFYIAVRSFFEKVIEYSLKTLPLDDEASTFLNFDK